jgi:flagellar basal body rod protein FlgG
LTKEEIAAGVKPVADPITTTNNKEVQSRITIDDNGKVFDNGKLLASLKIQQDTNTLQAIPELKLMIPVQQVIPRDPNTGNLMINVNAPAANTLLPGQREKVAIKQGFIESSNVSIISEMISLIHASKDYESGHKLIMSEDKILDKAINELGRTG